MSAIVVENVSKYWKTAAGRVCAVDSLSFELEAGTLNVLLGPSGCGKSTTLRLIAGLDRADSGRVKIDGVDVTEAPPAARNLSMVFQSYALFPHLTVAENIVFGLRVRKVASAERERRLQRVAGLLGLSSLLERKPSQISGGQQQRVALGRAFIAETPVCLMDEPLSNLDAQLRQEMRQEIRHLQRTLGITMVYVTHDQVEAMTMADRVILLSAGRIEQNGAPVDLYEAPANVFVARFIGTPPMNVIRPEGPIAAAVAAMVGSADRDQACSVADIDQLLVGVRPEHVTVASDRDGGINASVAAIEYLGADSLVACNVGSQAIIARVGGRVAFRRGDAVQLRWAAGAMHFFDAQTGRQVTGPHRHQTATMLA